MLKKEINFTNLLDSLEKFPEGFLYLKARKVNSFEKVLVVYNDPYFAEDSIEGYHYSLCIFQIEDILENLYQQISSPTLDQKIEAINYYIENDAFIDFGDK